MPLNLFSSLTHPDYYGAIKGGRHNALLAGEGDGIDGVGMSEERREFDFSPARIGGELPDPDSFVSRSCGEDESIEGATVDIGRVAIETNRLPCTQNIV